MHRRSLPLSGLLLLALLVGCPKLSMGPITVKDGSVTTTAVTLAAQVTVTEEDETEGPDQSRQSGRGLLGVQLPPGWSVSAARMRSPSETVDRALFASPQGAAAYAEAFPTTGGVWWAFASPTQEIAQGSWTYGVEIDLERPKKAKAGEVGVALSILNEDLTELGAPSQMTLSVVGKSATLLPRTPLGKGPAAPAPSDNSKAPTGG